MYIHKDIIIIIAFFLIVILVFAVVFIFDLKTFLNNLKSFPKKKITSHDQFFYRFFEPFIFNLNSIIENYENFLLIKESNGIIIKLNEQQVRSSSRRI